MKKRFSYLLALALFAACALNDKLLPGNLTEDTFGFVSRNIRKDRTELFEDMKEITKRGIISFEVYNEAGQLVTTLDEPADFELDLLSKIYNTKYTIKSSSKIQMPVQSNTATDL